MHVLDRLLRRRSFGLYKPKNVCVGGYVLIGTFTSVLIGQRSNLDNKSNMLILTNYGKIV